ncbi:hypothetical protein [uncultured Cetobacterium sp.]|uniref:hypothetical protein n=1 Tax=uncultured Cetobacterium sp. TaxID=527638 RepID=UPI00262DF3C3|nr:hypothetical protein [uncultured Cetobacterium sp.]
MKVIIYLFLMSILLMGCTVKDTSEKRYFPNERAYEMYKIQEELKKDSQYL